MLDAAFVGALEISSPVFAHGVHVEDHGREVVSDNWFDLLPGVPKRVRVAGGRDAAALRDPLPDELGFAALSPKEP